MATRAQVKTWIRNFLGTGADDPLYGDTSAGVSPLLDPIVQQVVDGIIADIAEANRAYLSKFATILPDTPTTGRIYSLATQSVPITDFSHWLELRYRDEDGALFDECRLEELSDAGADFFAITGPDEAAVIQVSRGTAAAQTLWLRYGYSPADLVDDTTPIPGIPASYHELVALEALYVFGIGGESRLPPELRERWVDTRASLIQHVTRRGVTPARTRLRGAPYL